MTFIIVSHSRKNQELLFMVDRRKQKASFWSNRLDDVLEYKSRDEAEKKAQSLKFNNPRVMSKKNAKAYMTRREREQIHEIAMDCQELGWDGHKNFF